MVLMIKPFFHHDPVRCVMDTLYGAVSEKVAKRSRLIRNGSGKDIIVLTESHHISENH